MNAIRLYIQDLKTLKKNKDNLGVALLLLFAMTFIASVLAILIILVYTLTKAAN